MAKARKRASRAAARTEQAPVSVKVVKAGTPAPGAQVEVTTGLTRPNKYLITVRPRSGRPVLLAVHL